jgi:hypothetical protein
MIASRSVLAVAFAILTVGSAEAGLGEGRPVTANDLSGKKICWSDGAWSAYAADGKYTSGRGSHGTWSVPEPGAIHFGKRYHQVEIMPDGRFHMYWFALLHGHDHDLWGTVCN